MTNLGEVVVDLHSDLVNKYRKHAAGIERIWRTLSPAQRTACMKAGVLDGQVLEHPLDCKLGDTYKLVPEWNLQDITKEGSDYFLDLLRFRATTELWDQYAMGLNNGPGDHAHIENLRPMYRLDNYFTVFLRKPGKYGRSFRIIRRDAEMMKRLIPAVDAGLCVPQYTGHLILQRQEFLLMALNIMVRDVLEAGSKTRAQKAPAKPDTAVTDALSKLQIQECKKKAKSQPSLADLVATAHDQKDVLEEHLCLLSIAPGVLARAVSHCFLSRPELVPDEKGRRLPVYTDKYISGAILETLHIAVQDAVVWTYVSRLLELLEAKTGDKVYRAVIVQEISNVCHFEYRRAQSMFKRILQYDMGYKWFKRVSNAYDKVGNARVTMKGKPEDLTATDPQLHYMLRLAHPETTAAKASDWLKKLGDLYESHPDERARLREKESETLFNLAVIVGFIQDLSPVISMPSFSRKKGQKFVSRFNDLETELNGLRAKVDLQEYAVPIDHLLEPGMAESALQSLDKFIIDKTGTKLGFLYQDTVADCLEHLERQCQQVKEKMERKDEPTPFPSSTTETTEARIEQRKQKEKTRGTPSSVYEITPHTPSPPAKPPAKPFKVSKATADVFSTFFNSAGERGTVNWSSFVGAMAELGFSVLPRFGSVYSFYPPETMEVKRPLTLHRPHGSEIGRHLILAFAQRLKRVYGWDEGNFVV
ncbi:hypothetical protein B0T21DRAFT_415643 [Apiosordaria backusii]|uniref:Ipa protein n=1 Tax=Apiosordaria backusii TaxID=314023 RepID=A0AA40AEJ8_9PEZI|nr:hypothetical protein B0T21DRAFT_415643 [Apiosordaria backusii]